MQSDQSHYIGPFFVRLAGLEEGMTSCAKPKLVLLHGLLGNGQNWIPTIRALQEKFTLLTFDQRGHGKTKTPSEGGFAPEDFAEDLKFITESLGWESFSLLGHSLGARVGFSFAASYPGCLEKVVFEDMGPHRTGETSLKTKKMINFVPTPFQDREQARGFFKDQFLPKYGKALADYLYANLEKKEEGSYDWRFDKEGALTCLKVGQERDFWRDFESVKAQNLIIRGEKSEHLPKNVLQEMLNRNKFSKAVEISSAGHWVHFDQFQAFVKAVENFLLE